MIIYCSDESGFFLIGNCYQVFFCLARQIDIHIIRKLLFILSITFPADTIYFVFIDCPFILGWMGWTTFLCCRCYILIVCGIVSYYTFGDIDVDSLVVCILLVPRVVDVNVFAVETVSNGPSVIGITSCLRC